jgi:hypothetical protein
LDAGKYTARESSNSSPKNLSKETINLDLLALYKANHTEIIVNGMRLIYSFSANPVTGICFLGAEA